MFFQKIAQAGGKPGIFWFSFIFSLSNSALDDWATAPPKNIIIWMLNAGSLGSLVVDLFIALLWYY